jgi:dTDP-4-amino-4,6-dideoxygalactose transaminase
LVEQKVTKTMTYYAEILAVIGTVCASQGFILGPAVKELEASVAVYSQHKYGIGVSSGTDTLLLSLLALEIEAGYKIIMSSELNS